VSSESKIEWTDATWNPTVGCEEVSPGCEHCYAAREASGRLRQFPTYAGLAVDGVFTGEVRLLRERLEDPLHWAKPRRIFVDSMSDLFHPDVPAEFIAAVFATMERARQHTFQVLTKRPQRMARLLHDREFIRLVDDVRGAAAGDFDWPLANVWLGVSIESKPYQFRAGHLLETPAAVRFLSIEPLLGSVYQALDLRGIDWVIVGGESGPKARPMHPDWAREMRWLCAKGTHADWCSLSLWLDGRDDWAGPWEPPECDCDGRSVPFLFKQWGEWGSIVNDGRATYLAHDGTTTADPWAEDEQRARLLETGEWRSLVRLHRCGKRAAGRHLDGKLWDEYPA
jgi:protein gp37